MTVSYKNPAADEWYTSIIKDPAAFPFAFTCDGKDICGFPADIFTIVNTKTQKADDIGSTDICFKKDDGLYITVNLHHYYSYGVTEWTLWFENRGASPSPVISDARTVLEFEGKYPCLKGILGDHVNKYRPYALDLNACPVYFESNSGRATHVNFPYFNLEYGDGGAGLAIGWAGTWRADFSYDDKKNITTYTARSVNRLHTRLLPGEKIRTALFVRAPYTVRNEAYFCNYWRRWFIDCNLPSEDSSGAPMRPFSTCCLASDTGRPNSDGSISEGYDTWRPSLEKMMAEDVKTDYRWLDAGWYIAPDKSTPEKDWWGTVGTWEPDPSKWPGDTLLESTDYARAHGMKTLMWFEPERVSDPENLAKNFGYDVKWAISVPGNKAVSNNIGDSECYKWTLERILKVLKKNRIEMYREDNNSDPAILWPYLDSLEGDDRTGITECRFIDAHYRMWDDIIACTSSLGGNAFVDSCASGGGRNDLESMRRGIPLLRSDDDRTTTSLRLSMTTAFNRWIPFCGANNKEKPNMLSPTGNLDMYIWRASYLPAMNVDSQFVQDPDQDFDMLRKGLKEWKQVSPYLLKDFYVLTSWHPETDTSGFTAYAFYDPEKSEGVLFAFRQEKCEEDALKLVLPFVDLNSQFVLTDADSSEKLKLSGDKAMHGFTLKFSSKREAKLFWVKKK